MAQLGSALCLCSQQDNRHPSNNDLCLCSQQDNQHPSNNDLILLAYPEAELTVPPTPEGFQ